jgi:hypothetical protein
MTRQGITTHQFWASTAERAVKTAAQAATALIGTGAVGVTSLDWAQIGSVALTAAVVSLLTSLASDRIGEPGPSLVGESGPRTPPLPPPLVAEVIPFDVPPAWPAPTPVPLTPSPLDPLPAAVDDDELARRQTNDIG